MKETGSKMAIDPIEKLTKDLKWRIHKRGNRKGQ